MRENARQIKPTWKLFLTTNEQPIFPADAAFRGRVHLVPFRADFSEAPETTIDATLRGELPGILAELLALCPSVVGGGLRPPAAVRGSTDELFAEWTCGAAFRRIALWPHQMRPCAVADVERRRQSSGAQREGLDADTRGILNELRKRFGKRYTVRKAGGSSVRVFAGVELLDARGWPNQPRVTACLKATMSSQTG